MRRMTERLVTLSASAFAYDTNGFAFMDGE